MQMSNWSHMVRNVSVSDAKSFKPRTAGITTSEHLGSNLNGSRQVNPLISASDMPLGHTSILQTALQEAERLAFS